MLTPISATSYAKTHNTKQKTAQKAPAFGQIVYFTEGTKAVSCSKAKENALLRRFAKTLKTLIYGEGPTNYRNKEQTLHGLVRRYKAIHFRIEENLNKKTGKHVLEIIPNSKETENTTIFVTKDKDNKGLLNEISLGLRRLREQHPTFTRNDSKV